jgi:hypothetical protein
VGCHVAVPLDPIEWRLFDFVFRIHILLKLTMVPSLYAVMSAWKLDKRTLIRFTDY